jgi:adenylate kinase
VISLEVPDSILEERICGRWIHEASGRTYHLRFHKPRIMTPKMLDDVTGEPLQKRPDDTPEILKSRLSTYCSQTVPVLGHYQRIEGVCFYANANQAIESVWEGVKTAMKFC